MSAVGSEGKCKDELVMSALGTGLGAVPLPQGKALPAALRTLVFLG